MRFGSHQISPESNPIISPAREANKDFIELTPENKKVIPVPKKSSDCTVF